MRFLLIIAAAVALALLATVTSAHKSDKNYELVGCRRLSGHKHRGIKARIGGIAANPAQCGELCSGLGYRFFALKPAKTAKNLCWCVRRRHAVHHSSKKRHHGKWLSKPRDKLCKRDEDVFLFRLKDSYGSLGCYSYNMTIEGLSGTKRSRLASPALCGLRCSRFLYFGLSDSRQCWCIGAGLHRARGKRESGCSQACPGDKARFCGSGSDTRLASVYIVLH